MVINIVDVIRLYYSYVPTCSWNELYDCKIVWFNIVVKFTKK
jgi:hypothetical protein